MIFKKLFSDILNEEEIGYIGFVDGYRLSVEGRVGNKLLQLACKRIAGFVIRAVRKAVYPADF